MRHAYPLFSLHTITSWKSHIADIIFAVVRSRETSLMMLHVWEEDIGSEGGIYQ